jgi:hypothetical protein
MGFKSRYPHWQFGSIQLTIYSNPMLIFSKSELNRNSGKPIAIEGQNLKVASV